MPIEIQILGQTHKSGGVKLINGIPTLSLLLMGCGNIDINNDQKKPHRFHSTSKDLTLLQK